MKCLIFHQWEIKGVENKVCSPSKPYMVFLGYQREISEIFYKCSRKGCNYVKSNTIDGYITLEELTKK